MANAVANVPGSQSNDVGHSLPQSIALHLIPAAFVMVFFVATAPTMIAWGFPPGFALTVGMLLIGIPIELGIMLFHGRQRHGAISLRGVVRYCDPIPVWQYPLFFVPLFGFALAVLILVGPFAELLAQDFFFWLPPYLQPDAASRYAQVAPSILFAALILGFLVDGIVNPIVEELYFRGFLLPRLAKWGWFAPLLNALLFSIQHYWQPYNVPLIFLIQLGVVYVVWWKRNIYISMLVHCAANSLGATLSLIAFFGST